MTETERKNSAEEIVKQFLKHISLKNKVVVAGYWPMGSEADCRPLLQELIEKGCGCALPVIQAGDAILHFQRYERGNMLMPNQEHKFMQPETSEEAIPDIVLVPLVAFDRQGYRIGQGGGFYDRTLAYLRQRNNVLAAGIAFACQECGAIPHEAHDEQLDWVVTEKEAIEIKD